MWVYFTSPSTAAHRSSWASQLCAKVWDEFVSCGCQPSLIFAFRGSLKGVSWLSSSPVEASPYLLQAFGIALETWCSWGTGSTVCQNPVGLRMIWRLRLGSALVLRPSASYSRINLWFPISHVRSCKAIPLIYVAQVRWGNSCKCAFVTCHAIKMLLLFL